MPGVRRVPTQDCRGIGETELGLLPAGAVLVNTTRGEVIQEEPLFRSLASGHLDGAGLDVWYNCPKSKEERTCTPVVLRFRFSVRC